jgi:hypothetical protein
MALTLPYPTLGPGPVDNAQIMANFNALADAIANLDNGNFKVGGALDINKISATYEYMPVCVRLSDGTATNEQIVPLYNDSKGNWSVVATQWATADTGTPGATCTFKIEWGVYNGGATPGAFTVTSTIDTVTLAGNDIASQGVDTSPTTSSLAFGGAGVHRALRFYISTTDATCGSPIYVSLLLKRQIAT